MGGERSPHVSQCFLEKRFELREVPLTMIRTATFKNFRGFEDFQLSDLSPVTLISGKNNVGKSSILEGIFLALDYRDTNSFLMLNSLRGSSVMPEPDILWTPLLLRDRKSVV